MEMRFADRSEANWNGRQKEQQRCKPEERQPEWGDGYDKGTKVTKSNVKGVQIHRM
jgi:hypothetical protein